MADTAALIAATLLSAVAVFHFYWAAGGFWPGRDARSLADWVVGVAPEGRIPGPLPTGAVGVALLAAAALVLAQRALIPSPLPHGWLLLGTWGVGAVFGVRGLGGFFERRFRPQIAPTAYARANERIYSPLCVSISALVLVSLLVGA